MNKKLSQLTEKVTSLSADDLLYVSVNGESKSIKASTVEAPLKAYADQKKSELITEIETLDEKVDSEITNRQAADDIYLDLAKAYVNSELASIQSEIETINSANSTIYYNATMYTNAEVGSLRSAVDFDLETLSNSISSTYATKEAVTSEISQSQTSQNQVITGWLSDEATSRQSAIDGALQDAKDYTDLALEDAKNYTNTAIANVSASSGSIPTGVVSMFAGTVAPTGYLLCDGSAVSRSTYSALFSVIGTSYGVGNGSTTFNLPNPDSNANIRLIIKI